MAPGVRRSEPAGARMVPPREGNEARGDGRRGIGAPHTTGEAGESCPRNPVEGRGRREMDPLAGKTANTPRLEPVSTLRQRIAERARHALGMAWVIFIASWTNGYATARSEAICRGAGCGRTRTSGSVGGQGQQRPWSTRTYQRHRRLLGPGQGPADQVQGPAETHLPPPSQGDRMALQPSPRQQVHIPATVPTQDPAQRLCTSSCANSDSWLRLSSVRRRSAVPSSAP